MPGCVDEDEVSCDDGSSTLDLASGSESGMLGGGGHFGRESQMQPWVRSALLLTNWSKLWSCAGGYPAEGGKKMRGSRCLGARGLGSGESTFDLWSLE